MTRTTTFCGLLTVTALASAQTIPTASQCPAANGQTITDSNGSIYQVTCSSDNNVGSYTNTKASSSYLDCMTACDTAASAGCQGFTYVGGTNGVGSGTCWLKKSMGTYTTASNTYISAIRIGDAVSSPKSNVASTLTTSVSSTASVSSAAVASSTNLCPSSNFTNYADTAGNNWQILCGFDTSPGSFGSTSASTFQLCLQACKLCCCHLHWHGMLFQESFLKLDHEIFGEQRIFGKHAELPSPGFWQQQGKFGMWSFIASWRSIGRLFNDFQSYIKWKGPIVQRACSHFVQECQGCTFDHRLSRTVQQPAFGRE
jgi:hypothetical protein